MKHTLMIAAIAALSAAQAGAQNYQWTPSQIQGLGDVTLAFGSNQLSTINSITPIPGGIELDVTFRVGQDSSSFDPNFGATFARVSLQGVLGFPGLNIAGSTGGVVSIESTVDLTLQSFVQTDFTEDGGAIDDGDANPGESFSFLFWEHNSSIASPGPVDGVMDFQSATEFSGDWGVANPQPVQGLDAVRQWGVQLAMFDNPPVIGQPINATIRITSTIPEPTTFMLAGASMVGLAMSRRRR
jgi:hypothetical protein